MTALLRTGTLALALATPAAAIAQDKDCRVTNALLTDSKTLLSRVAVQYNRKGTLDVTYQSKPDIFRGATDCELRSPQDFFELSCSWDFDADEAAARQKLSVLRVQLGICLPDGLEDIGPGDGYETLEVPVRYRATVSLKGEADDEATVRLYLYKYGSYDPPHYSVDVAFER